MRIKSIEGRLRVANPEETDRILAFYRENRHRYLLPRPERDFERAVCRGNFLVVEIGGSFVAASGVFDYSEDKPFVELAETSVAAPVQGYGLQASFFRHRVASVVVSQGPSVMITTAVDPGNEFSLRNVRGLGFQAWKKPIPEAHASCSECPARPAANSKRACCCDFYILPVEKAREAVSAALGETESGSLKFTRKTPGLVLRSECLFMNGDFRGMLRDFVDGRDW